MSKQDWCRPGRYAFVVNEGVWKLINIVTEDYGVFMEDGTNYCRTELSEDRVIYDMVNHPPHYQLREGYEVYDLRGDLARKAQQHDVPHDQYSDWDRALEYLIRMWGKNGVEDARKAAWYLDKLIGKMEAGK